MALSDKLGLIERRRSERGPQLFRYFRQLPNESPRSCGRVTGVGTVMASKALSDQVAAKWQDSFNRLNRGAPGISGLMGFSRVRGLHPPLSLLFNPRVAPVVLS
jgi:hypothetical protein